MKKLQIFNLLIRNAVFFIVCLSTAAFGQTKNYANINGLKMYYEIHGAGQPLILIHGGLGSTGMFGANLDSLAKKRQVIAVDMQAHGRTADIGRPLSLELMADDIAALIKQLGFQKADIAGYSMGGCIALQTVISHPELVSKLAIISAPFKRTGFYQAILAQQDQMGPQAAEFMKQTPMYQSYAGIAPKPENWTALVTKVGELIKKNYDWSAEIKKIKVPVLLVFGDADLIPPSHAVEFFGLLGGGQKDGGWDRTGLSNSRLSILPDVTHYEIFRSPLMAAAVTSFLDEPVADKK
jgi:pimeloyl-ACP methyl ester carboxylesterase